MTTEGPTGNVPGTGSSDPGSSSPEEAQALQAELERIKKENAELREERRVARAQSLGQQFGLDEATVELISKQKADEMEDYAKRIADARAGGTPPPSELPPNPPANTDPEALKALGQQPAGGTPPKTPTPAEAMQAEIAAAKTLEEIQAIQTKYIQLEREQQAESGVPFI